MTGVSTLGQALDQIERLKDQRLLFDTLTTQLTTGKKTQDFSGLGTDVIISKRARADFQSLDVYVNNITNAERRVNLMLNAIEEFKAQAENFANFLISFPQENTHQEGEIVYFDDPGTPNVNEHIGIGMSSANPSVDLETLQDFAGNIFSFLIELLNQRDGDRFLLAGAETSTRPISDTGTLDSAIATLLNEWKTEVITTDDLIADLEERTTTGGNLDAITDTIVGYSSVLSAGNVKDVFVRTDEDVEVDFTVLANEEPFRDIIVAAAYFKSEGLPPMADAYDVTGAVPVLVADGAPGNTLDQQQRNFFRVFETLAVSINNALDDIDAIRFRLENVKVRLNQNKEAHIAQQNQLLDTVAGVEDVDINDVAVKLNTLQVQLDASFRVTARLQEISLVNFL